MASQELPGISAAKVQQIFDMTKFLSKKMQKMCIFNEI